MRKSDNNTLKTKTRTFPQAYASSGKFQLQCIYEHARTIDLSMEFLKTLDIEQTGKRDLSEMREDLTT